MIKREARYLAINDLGKTVKGVDVAGGKFDGELTRLNGRKSSDTIFLGVRRHRYSEIFYITPETLIIIAGKEQS